MMKYTSPLATKLMRIVLGIYLLTAIILTALQMLMEYQNEEKRLYRQIRHMATTFTPMLANAMWNFNIEQLDATMSGIVGNYEIVGMSVVDEESRVINLGIVSEKQNMKANYQGKLLPIGFDINFKLSNGRLIKLGQSVLFSSQSFVVDQVANTLFVIFVSACAKTLFLWIIFVVVLKRLVADPLEKLSQLMQDFKATGSKLNTPTSRQDSGLIPLSDLPQNDTVFTGNELEIVKKSFVDMTEYISQQQKDLLLHQNNLTSIFEALPDVYFRLNNSGTIIDYRAQNIAEFYAEPEQFLGRMMVDVLPRDAAKIFSENFNRYIELNEQNTWEYYLNINGEQQAYEARLRAIENRDEFIIVVRNITERINASERIWYQANIDELTELPNRKMLYIKLKEEINRSDRSHHPVAVLFLDLDQFKEVNDTLGHDMGDILLKEAALRIKASIRDIDFAARLGGDEFTIILSELVDVNVVERICSRLLSELSKPFQLDVDVAYVTASIGITLYPLNASNIQDLLKTADQAMYAAKAQGKNCFHFFTPSIQDAAMKRMHLVNDLRVAITENQFVLYFQPIISMRTGLVCKAEALLRWNHPTRGLVPPDEFISLSEETNMIIDIGNWVFEEAVKSVIALKDVYGEEFQLSFNISPVQFASEESDFDFWLAYLNDASVPGHSIIGEITEGIMMKATKETSRKLTVFSEKGIQLAIDDFGTGYSSLSYIKEYNMSYLKIDSSFVKNLTADSEDYVLCEAIIVMAHKLGMKVVAEGIETKEQYDLLESIDCDFGQGYLISKPVELSVMLARQKEVKI